MVAAASDGVKFPPIDLNIFEDGEIYIHNGHHRAVSLWVAERGYLSVDEFRYTEYTYKEYDEINWDGWYITPFNVKTDVRLSDFKEFRYKVMRLYWSQSPKHAEHYIRTNKLRYSAPRMLRTLTELVDKVFSAWER
jgi:hypothetical protein